MHISLSFHLTATTVRCAKLRPHAHTHTDIRWNEWTNATPFALSRRMCVCVCVSPLAVDLGRLFAIALESQHLPRIMFKSLELLYNNPMTWLQLGTAFYFCFSYASFCGANRHFQLRKSEKIDSIDTQIFIIMLDSSQKLLIFAVSKSIGILFNLSTVLFIS